MKVRLVGDNIPDNQAIYEKRDAYKLAETLELDLVKISEGKDYPIYKIINKEKYIYDNRLKEKERARNRSKIKQKEIRIRPNISEGDIETKVNQCLKFAEKRYPLKVTMVFRGFELRNKKVGEIKLLEFIDKLKAHYKPSRMPKLINRRMDVNLTPLEIK